MKEMKDQVAENRADLKNVPCGNDSFSVKFFDTWRVRDQNVTCQETWRVGGCHVPDTSVVASGLGRSCATYQGKPWLWYLTARGVSLIGPINSWSSSNFRTCVSYVLFRKFNKARRSILNLCHRVCVFCSESYVEAIFGIALLTHGLHSSISYRCLLFTLFTHFYSPFHYYLIF